MEGARCQQAGDSPKSDSTCWQGPTETLIRVSLLYQYGDNR
jgi:hypothetical protein